MQRSFIAFLVAYGKSAPHAILNLETPKCGWEVVFQTPKEANTKTPPVSILHQRYGFRAGRKFRARLNRCDSVAKTLVFTTTAMAPKRQYGAVFHLRTFRFGGGGSIPTIRMLFTKANKISSVWTLTRNSHLRRGSLNVGIFHNPPGRRSAIGACAKPPPRCYNKRRRQI